MNFCEMFYREKKVMYTVVCSLLGFLTLQLIGAIRWNNAF